MDLDTEGRREWLSLMRATAAPNELFALMHDLRLAGKLPGEFMKDYAELGRALGRVLILAPFRGF